MTALSTEQLTWLNDALKMAGWVLAIFIGLALLGEWISGRELERRRTGDSAKMRTQVETAEREARELRQRFAPREISAEQREQMLAALRDSHGNLQIIYPADPEAKAFAERIGGVISAAGWQVSLVGGMSFGPIFGFVIGVRDIDRPPPSLSPLRSALQAAFGGEIKVQSRPSMVESSLDLSVGVKPAE